MIMKGRKSSRVDSDPAPTSSVERNGKATLGIINHWRKYRQLHVAVHLTLFSRWIFYMISRIHFWILNLFIVWLLYVNIEVDEKYIINTRGLRVAHIQPPCFSRIGIINCRDFLAFYGFFIKNLKGLNSDIFLKYNAPKSVGESSNLQIFKEYVV